MESLAATRVPVGPLWTYELKLDGFRAEAIKQDRRVTLYSRRKKELGFPDVAAALKGLPDGTVIDGELVALDLEGRPSFNLLQNYRSASAHIVYFAFDILAHEGRDLTHLPLSDRRSLLRRTVQPNESVTISEWSTSAKAINDFVEKHALEGVVAKRIDSKYEPGKRSGAWTKVHRLLHQEFVIGGFTPSHLGVDALIVGFYRGGDLQFTGRVRGGFIPRSRRIVYDKIKHLETQQCPFTNLPDKSAGAWGQGLTAEKMKECVWLKPEAVARIEFSEWTPGDRLRRPAFVSLRDDKNPRKVVNET